MCGHLKNSGHGAEEYSVIAVSRVAVRALHT